MIIFLDEAAACRHWLTHHRRGCALERRRKGKTDAFVLHAATCRALKDVVERRRAQTRRWIACSLHRDELERWCETERGTQPAQCVACAVAEGAASNRTAAHPASRLARDVLDYVLDVAIIHLEPDAKPYALTVSDVGQCLHKTPGQLAAALGRLTDEGLTVLEDAGKRAARTDHRRIYPTVAGLRTLPYFAGRTRAEVEAECRRLRPDR